jgi:hypothetical protein
MYLRRVDLKRGGDLRGYVSVIRGGSLRGMEGKGGRDGKRGRN